MSSAAGFTLNAGTLLPGPHTVQVVVHDPTPLVQNDPGSALTDSAIWVVTVSAGASLTVVRSLVAGGDGTVSGPGIACGADCAEVYATGTMVTLTASAVGGSTFGGWSGCDSAVGPSCTVEMNASRAVTATFTRLVTLTVARAGSGAGSVASGPPGISCGATCVADFDGGTVVTLTATAGTGSTFLQWSGACGGAATTCMVTMSVAKSVTATFQRTFTDATSQAAPTLPAGTVVKAVHFTEILDAVNALRAARAMASAGWLGVTPAPGGGDPRRAAHRAPSGARRHPRRHRLHDGRGGPGDDAAGGPSQ